jgi:hypothetical protein
VWLTLRDEPHEVAQPARLHEDLAIGGQVDGAMVLMHRLDRERDALPSADAHRAERTPPANAM